MGFTICSSCDFVAHLDCAMDKRNMDDINMLEELRDDESTGLKTMLDNENQKLNESVDLIAYRVKKINIREDRTEITTEIEYFSHEHDLKLVHEI
uniref:DC1 domain-containing protein n=1 Tax=Quercus lobata TaxID=97700 RepID=A0A7N2MS47_QUELO